MASLEDQWWTACCQDDLARAEAILLNHPGFDVNCANTSYGLASTGLKYACGSGSLKIVALLLNHPHIDVNRSAAREGTPFYAACQWRFLEVVKVMLLDSRVLINEPRVDGLTPLYWLARRGVVEIFKWVIASGRDLDLEVNSPQTAPGRPDVLSEARNVEYWATPEQRTGKAALVPLLESFIADPDQTRYHVRCQLGFMDQMAASLFAPVVFVSDGLLNVKDHSPQHLFGIERFFLIMLRLPMELQMAVCCRAVGCVKDNISRGDCEVAFRALAKSLM
jgi:hypothetical protein